jgi:hypothetical protein
MRNSRTADPGGGQGAENRLGSADGHFRAARRVILKATRGQPIRGSGHLTFECGNCGAVVLENVELPQIRDCVIECDCGTFNATPH